MCINLKMQMKLIILIQKNSRTYLMTLTICLCILSLLHDILCTLHLNTCGICFVAEAGKCFLLRILPKYLIFACYLFSVAGAQLCCYSTNLARGYKKKSIRLLTKQVAHGFVTGYSLLTLNV